jgi:hypothetical protein
VSSSLGQYELSWVAVNDGQWMVSAIEPQGSLIDQQIKIVVIF